MKQPSFFDDEQETPQGFARVHDPEKPRPEVLKGSCPIEIRCNLEDMSECLGPMFFNGGNIFRCARHITLQRLWVSDSSISSLMDLRDWIREEGDRNTPRDLFSDCRGWYRVVDGKIRFDLEGVA